MSDLPAEKTGVFDLGGGASDAAGLLTDETRLLQVFKMAEMGIMLASVLHEIRQPLFSIKGYVQMMLLESYQDGKVDERLAKVHELLMDLEKRATLFLDFSRHPSSHMMPTDIHDSVRGAVDLFRNRMAKSKVELHLEFASGLPLINGNFLMLQQVLVNLLHNSLHAFEGIRPENGRHIWVRTQLQESGKEIDIVFADNGLGIASEHAHRVFDFFFTTKPDGVGTGLGLSISREIAQAHGGQLALVDSSQLKMNWVPKPSTVFRLTVPVFKSGGLGT